MIISTVDLKIDSNLFWWGPCIVVRYRDQLLHISMDGTHTVANFDPNKLDISDDKLKDLMYNCFRNNWHNLVHKVRYLYKHSYMKSTRRSFPNYCPTKRENFLTYSDSIVQYFVLDSYKIDNDQYKIALMLDNPYNPYFKVIQNDTNTIRLDAMKYTKFNYWYDIPFNVTKEILSKLIKYIQSKYEYWKCIYFEDMSGFIGKDRCEQMIEKLKPKIFEEVM